MSFDPRRSLEGLINTLQGKDPTMWQILRTLANLTNANTTTLSTLTSLTSVQVTLQVKTPTVAHDIADYWPTLILPVNNNGDPLFTKGYVSQVVISAKTVPSGAAAVFDLLYSSNNGVTFATLFQGISFQLPKGVNRISYGNMTTKTFPNGTIFRLDCSAVNSVAGVTVTLLAVPQ